MLVLLLPISSLDVVEVLSGTFWRLLRATRSEWLSKGMYLELFRARLRVHYLTYSVERCERSLIQVNYNRLGWMNGRTIAEFVFLYHEDIHNHFKPSDSKHFSLGSACWCNTTSPLDSKFPKSSHETVNSPTLLLTSKFLQNLPPHQASKCLTPTHNFHPNYKWKDNPPSTVQAPWVSIVRKTCQSTSPIP